MWRQVSLLAPFYAQNTSPQREVEGLEIHTHSPRKLAKGARHSLPAQNLSSMPPPDHPVFRGHQPTHDPFVEPPPPEFKKWRQPSDTSMADYSSAATRSTGSRHVTDPLSLSDKQDRRFETLQSAGAYDTLCEALTNPNTSPKAPVNTPQMGSEIAEEAISAEGIASITAALRGKESCKFETFIVMAT